MTERVQLKILIDPRTKELLENYSKYHGSSVNATITKLIELYNQQNYDLMVLELHKHGALKVEDNG